MGLSSSVPALGVEPGDLEGTGEASCVKPTLDSLKTAYFLTGQFPAEGLSNLPMSIPRLSWLGRQILSARPDRKAGMAEVLAMVLDPNTPWKELTARGLRGERMTVQERRALVLYLGQKWWFTEDLAGTAFSKAPAIEAMKSAIAAKTGSGRLPIERLVEDGGSSGIFKSLLSPFASIQETARSVKNPAAITDLSELLKAQILDLDAEVARLRKARPHALSTLSAQYRLRKMNLLLALLQEGEKNWGPILKANAAEQGRFRRLGERLLMEVLPAGTKHTASLALQAGILGAAIFTVHEIYGTKTELVPLDETGLGTGPGFEEVPEPVEPQQAQHQQSQNPLIQLERALNNGELTPQQYQTELKKLRAEHPELFDGLE